VPALVQPFGLRLTFVETPHRDALTSLPADPVSSDRSNKALFFRMEEANDRGWQGILGLGDVILQRCFYAATPPASTEGLRICCVLAGALMAADCRR